MLAHAEGKVLNAHRDTHAELIGVLASILQVYYLIHKTST